RVGHLRVGHDRRGVAVDQHHPVPLLAQRLARLRAGVVELAGLADDDRAGADDEDGLEVVALWHQCFSACVSDMDATKRSNSGDTSRGPGEASGWPWNENAGESVSSMPWLVPSNSERWMTRTLAGRLDSSTAKPWFCEVIITRPSSSDCTGWLAPWWPLGIFMVFAPAASASSWWPRQMPNMGNFFASSSRIAAIA